MKKAYLLSLLVVLSTTTYSQSIKSLEQIALTKLTIAELSKKLGSEYEAPIIGDKAATGDIGCTYKSKTNPNKVISVLYNSIFKQAWFFSIKDSSENLPRYMTEFKNNGYSAHSPQTSERGLVKKYPYKKGKFQGVIEIGAEVGDGKLIVDFQYEIN